MDDEKIVKTGAVVDTTPVNIEQDDEAIRKSEFEKARKKILTVHDGLFRRLAQ